MVLAIARLAYRLGNNSVKNQILGYEVLFMRRWFCSKEVITGDDKTAVVDEPSSKEIGNKLNVTSTTKWKSRKNKIWKIINRNRDFVPALYVHFPSGLGDAIIQATNNINTLCENKPISKSIGPVKELENCYKMRYVGIGNENVKFSVEDGVLRVKENGKKEDENGFDDERWEWSFGCYEKTLALPKDAKADEIKAEVNDGVLNIVVPKNNIKELPSS